MSLPAAGAAGGGAAPRVASCCTKNLPAPTRCFWSGNCAPPAAGASPPPLRLAWPSQVGERASAKNAQDGTQQTSGDASLPTQQHMMMHARLASPGGRPSPPRWLHLPALRQLSRRAPAPAPWPPPAVMAYATSHLSGGQLNPAVTLGLALVGALGPAQAAANMLAQVCVYRRRGGGGWPPLLLWHCCRCHWR